MFIKIVANSCLLVCLLLTLFKHFTLYGREAEPRIWTEFKAHQLLFDVCGRGACKSCYSLHCIKNKAAKSETSQLGKCSEAFFICSDAILT